MRLASVSIDLDGLRHYETLYGLGAESQPDAVAALAPVRLAELLDEIRAQGTFFAIGRELLPSGGPLRHLAEAGHEIGNHTLTHPYAVTRLSAAELRQEVEGGARAIAEATGQRPIGFRAPGYTLSAALLDAAAEAGHRYDSSVFPSVPYYLAKASVLALLRARGRPSAAILDRPRVLLAPIVPYRPARREPYARGDHPLLELPLAIDPLLRLPFFGTLVVSFPWSVVRAVYASVRRLPFLNLELHGVDLLDASDGISPALAAAQRDLRVPLRQKLDRLRQVFSWLARDYELVTLARAAERLAC
jgi:peptidoglycan-N-acetylglucosamine deacetylase